MDLFIAIVILDIKKMEESIVTISMNVLKIFTVAVINVLMSLVDIDAVVIMALD